MQELEDRVAPVVGPWAKSEILPGITALQAALAGLLLVAIGLAILWLRGAARRKVAPAATVEATEPAAAAATGASWFRLTLREAHPPLLLALLVCGLYGTLCFLLFRVPFHAGGIIALLGWAFTVGLIVALFWFLFRMINVVEIELNRWAARTPRKWDNILAAVVVRALRMIIPLIGVLLVIPTLDLPERGHALLQTATSLLLTGFIGLILCQLIGTAEKAVAAEYRVDVKDNLAVRKIQTQVRILRKIVVALVIVVTVACMLTEFAAVRTLGHSILASAGVAGIVIGVAAQRSLGTLLAGIQIAFTQPMRLDDVVIVEGEWGRIEEITLTYVVVAIWDLRRMVLPITYFIEKPFQNWTRSRADLLGTVFLYLDYTAPIDAMRAELDRIVEASPRWDRKVKGLQVTDAREHTLEVRVLASASDSGQAFNLRCEIREKLVDFLQRHHPGALPRTRAVIEPADAHVTEAVSKPLPPPPKGASAESSPSPLPPA